MVNGIRAFLPGSLVDMRPVKDTTPYEGKTLEFKVIKLDRKRNNVVVSRRAVVESDRWAKSASKLLETLQEGAVVKGVVKNITDYGAFVDLGGIDGLLHITDMAWRRVQASVAKSSRSARRSTPRSSSSTTRRTASRSASSSSATIRGSASSRRYPPGTRLFGKVTNITDYGAFVEIEPGIEGLVHVSEMDWTNKNVHPSQGRAARRRGRSHGPRDRRGAPPHLARHEAVQAQSVGGVRRRTTRRATRSRARSSRSPTSACSSACRAASTAWCTCPTCRGTSPAKTAVRNYKKGQEVEAIVLAIDVERERISLGIKQLDGDPFTSFVADARQGQHRQRARSRRSTRKGADDRRSATASKATCAPPRSRATASRTRARVLKEGDEVEAMIINIDRKSRIDPAVDQGQGNAEEAEAMQNYTHPTRARSTTGTTASARC